MQDKPPGKKPKGNLNDLAFVRLLDPIHIPSYLIKQMPDRSYPVEKFYSYQKMVCLISGENGSYLNPSNFLYALVHEELRQVKGFSWMVADFLNDRLVVNAFSIDGEYWIPKETVALIDSQAKKIAKELQFEEIIWLTKNKKICEHLGYRPSKWYMMCKEGDYGSNRGTNSNITHISSIAEAAG